MRDKPIYDSSLFWVAFGAAIAVIGGIFAGIGVAATGANPGARIWSDWWFRIGIGLVFLGLVLLWWALTLYLAHRHSDRHLNVSGPGDLNSKGGQQAATFRQGPAQLRADLVANLQAVREFKTEYDKIMPPPGAPISQTDAVDTTLYRLAAERLGDIPLRPYEVLIVGHILRDAIQSLDNLPFASMQPGNEATDIQSTGERRRCSEGIGEQMWHLPTSFKAYGAGIIRSDQTLDTLTDLHRRLMKLRREVYDKFHPPSFPGAPKS
jgi:hypothetical protein